MQNMESKTKNDMKRMTHFMSEEQKNKAVKASGVLTARNGKRCSLYDAINTLFEEGYNALEIEKSA